MGWAILCLVLPLNGHPPPLTPLPPAPTRQLTRSLWGSGVSATEKGVRLAIPKRLISASVLISPITLTWFKKTGAILERKEDGTWSKMMRTVVVISYTDQLERVLHSWVYDSLLFSQCGCDREYTVTVNIIFRFRVIGFDGSQSWWVATLGLPWVG